MLPYDLLNVFVLPLLLVPIISTGKSDSLKDAKIIL